MNYYEIISDVFIIETDQFVDERGYFVENYNKKLFDNLNININFVQDNLSMSLKKGTIRGLHFQDSPNQQSKFVSVASGSIFDVFVDIRPGSENFGKWNSVVIDSPNKGLFIPKGFLHGFCSLEENTIVSYKVDNFYDKNSELGVIWNDKDLMIEWPIKNEKPIISFKDSNLMTWSNFINKIKINDE
jgi:dTDP-4-dehydrorhamnose 3,5-epimerase